MFQTEHLQEKWQPVLEHNDLPEISDSYRKAVTTVILENQEKALAGQLSPQEALDEVAKEWEAIVNRVGMKNVQEDYAVGVKMEDNKL
mgnify:CR=1 FL=1